jgi:dolichyl-phosphate beta-glucosyltransferase
MQKTIVVIPCYNEAERLKVDEFNYLLDQPGLELLFVNDGSMDNTEQLLKELIKKNSPGANLLNLSKNQGKAEAVRQGMLHAIDQGASMTGFVDADMATPSKEVLRLLDKANKGRRSVILGSRVRLLGYAIDRRPMRHYIGRIFATFASLILRLPVYDTQCGAKLFIASPLLKESLTEPFCSRWIFDVELIGRLLTGSDNFKPLTADDFIEVPLKEWMDVNGSKIAFWDFVKAARDLMKIAIRLKRRRQKTIK